MSDTFRSQLDAQVAARGLDPFTERLRRGELTRAQLGAFAVQHRHYVSQFPRWCAAMYAGCPDVAARDFLLENLIEEETGTRHTELLLRWAEACGVGREATRTIRPLPSTRGFVAWGYDMARRPFQEAAAGLLIGLEAQVPRVYAATLGALREHYDFSEHELEFFAIHIEADAVHSQRGYEIVERVCSSAEAREVALEAVRQAVEMRRHYMVGNYRAHVLGEEP
jgi:pyrroloquinoline-quinone synthase